MELSYLLIGDYYQWGRATDGHEKKDRVPTMDIIGLLLLMKTIMSNS